MPWIEPQVFRDPNRTLFTTMSTHSQAGNALQSVWTRPSAAAVWPAVERIIAVPVLLEFPFTIAQIAVYNGTVNAATKIDVGFHNEAGVLLTSKGLTTQSGASQPQVFDVADYTGVPGVYFVSMMVDADVSTATFFRATFGFSVLEAAGVQQMAGSLGVPIGNLTFAAPASSYLPFIVAGGTVL